MQSQVRTWALAAAAAMLVGATASAQYSENFESYPAGPIDGLGGWHQWDLSTYVTADASVFTAPAPVHGGTKSLGTRYTSDVVQTWSTYTTGHWDIRCWTYVDSTMSGDQIYIWLTEYVDLGPKSWATQLWLKPGTGTVHCDNGWSLTTCSAQYNSPTADTSLIFNQWVEVVIDVDVDNDTATISYGGTQLGDPFPWSKGPFGQNGGTITSCPPPPYAVKAIACVDLYANSPAYAPNTGTPQYMYYDDLTITPHSPLPTNYCTVGTTAGNNCAPAIGYLGTASATASSGFTLICNNVDPNASGLFFYGISGSITPAPWGTGGSFMCVKSPNRMGLLNSGPGFGCVGSFTQDWNAYMATTPSAPGNPRAAGAAIEAQLWMRDPPSAKTTILSDALHFILAP